MHKLTLLICSGVLSLASTSTQLHNLSTSLAVNLALDTVLPPFHLYPRAGAPPEKLVELNRCIKEMQPRLSTCGKAARKASALCPVDYLLKAFSAFKDVFTQRRRRRKRQAIEAITWLFGKACNCVRLYVNCALDIMCYECTSELVTPNYVAWMKWKHPYYFQIFRQACNIKMKIVRKPLCSTTAKPDSSLNFSSSILVAVVVVLIIMMLLLIALFGGFVIFNKRAKKRVDKKKDANLKRKKRTSSVGGGASSPQQASSSKGGGTSTQTVHSPSSMPTKLGALTKFSRSSTPPTSPTSPLSNRKAVPSAKGLTGSPKHHRRPIKPPSPKAIKTTNKHLPISNRTVSKGNTL